MKKTFQIANVKCGGCAATLKSKLLEEFGKIEVNLDTEPREITLNVDKNKINDLALALKKLGYPFADEEMGFVDSTSTKAKSFVSCAIGKMN